MDYAPNYTPRYRVRYRVNGLVHTVQMRYARDTPDVSVVGAATFTDVLQIMASQLMADFAILGADVAGQDSDIFLPATAIPVVTGLSAVNGDLSTTPLYISFVGRSSAGHRAVFFLYGFVSPPTGGENTANDYRILSSESENVQEAVAILNGLGGVPLMANDNNPVTWYPYVNVGFNSYYQRRARRG